MSDSRTRRYRDQRAAEQHHLCYYCLFPMWTTEAKVFADAHHITIAEAARFRCTAEHLQALCEGGTSRLGNIVAACRFCNERRHRRNKRLSPDVYMVRVRRHVAKLRWHPSRLHKLREPITVA